MIIIIINDNNNNNVHLACAHERPERSHDINLVIQYNTVAYRGGGGGAGIAQWLEHRTRD